MKPRSSCELCGSPASVYCSSDSAFLCAGCDARVHGANFLAARHVRTPVASPSPTPFHSGSSSAGGSDDEADDSASSSVRSAASSCISTAESAPSAAGRSGRRISNSNRSNTVSNRRLPRSRMKKTSLAASTRARVVVTGVDARAEGVLASWCAKLGEGAGGGMSANCAAVVSAHALAIGLRRLGAAVPPRVCAAAAVWFAVKLCGGGRHGGSHHQYLRRLEECSGVPARIIAAAEGRLSRVVRSRQVDAEGWAECGI